MLEAAKSAWAEGEAERRATASLLEEARSEAAKVKASASPIVCLASSTQRFHIDSPFQYYPVDERNPHWANELITCLMRDAVKASGILTRTGLVQAKSKALAEEERELSQLRTRLAAKERQWHESAADHASTAATAQVHSRLPGGLACFSLLQPHSAYCLQIFLTSSSITKGLFQEVRLCAR